MFAFKNLAFVTVLLASLAHSLVADRTPCSHDITLGQFGECIAREAENYHPEFKETQLSLENLDPLPLGSFEVKTGDFIIYNKNTIMRGLSNAIIVDVGWDFNDNTSYTILSGNMTLTSDYNTSGSILFLPVTSRGKLTVNAYDAKIKITYKFRKIEEDSGDERLETYDFKTTQEFGLLTFNLETGNMIVDAMMNAALNYNWRTLATVGPAKVAEIIANKLGDSTNKIFNLLSFDEIFNYI